VSFKYSNKLKIRKISKIERFQPAVARKFVVCDIPSEEAKKREELNLETSDRASFAYLRQIMLFMEISAYSATSSRAPSRFRKLTGITWPK
jgi:hypothetical protein